jgi:hypothetical protein
MRGVDEGSRLCALCSAGTVTCAMQHVDVDHAVDMQCSCDLADRSGMN